MSGNPGEWLVKAKGDLRQADSAYTDHEYWDAISHLQEANEKIAKALLIKLGFLPTSEGLRNTIEAVFGAKRTRPKDLGHNWAVRLIEDFGPYMDSLQKITNSLPKSESFSQARNWWSDTLPSFRTNVKSAKKLKAKPSPSLEELDNALADCDKFLEMSKTIPAHLSLDSNRTFNLEEMDQSVASLIKDVYGIAIDKRTRLETEAKALENIGQIVGGIQETLRSVVEMCYVWAVLAVLNVYLSLHHIFARYPTKRVAYDENLSLVIRFQRIHALHRRVLDEVDQWREP